MAWRVINLNCPGCGAPVDTSQSGCPSCGRPIVVSSFNLVQDLPLPQIGRYAGAYQQALAGNSDDARLNTSAAFCYLKLKLYDKALPCFEKAIEDNFNQSETFFYAAVCLLRGQKAFTTPIQDIRKAIEYLEAANRIEARGIYHYFLAYLKYDFFERKSLNVRPNYQEELRTARKLGVSVADIQALFALLDKPVPAPIAI